MVKNYIKVQNMSECTHFRTLTVSCLQLTSLGWRHALKTADEFPGDTVELIEPAAEYTDEAVNWADEAVNWTGATVAAVLTDKAGSSKAMRAIGGIAEVDVVVDEVSDSTLKINTTFYFRKRMWEVLKLF